MNATIATWLKDPEFNALPFSARQAAIRNYFDTRVADAQFANLPQSVQDETRARFVGSHLPAEQAAQRGFLAETASALGSGLVAVEEALAGTVELGLSKVAPDTRLTRAVGDARKMLGATREAGALARPQYLAHETVLEHPERLADWRWWVRSLGENLPNMAAMMLPGVAAMKGAQAAGMGVKAIRAAGLAGAWSGGATIEAGFAYGEAKDEMAAEGKYSAEQIERIATAEALVIGTVNGILEILPFDNLFLRAARADKIIKRIVRQGIIEGVTETAQEAVSIYVEKLGHKPDQTFRENLGRMLEAGIIGTALGGGAGGVLRPAHLAAPAAEQGAAAADKVAGGQGAPGQGAPSGAPAPMVESGAASAELAVEPAPKVNQAAAQKAKVRAEAEQILASVIQEVAAEQNAQVPAQGPADEPAVASDEPGPAAQVAPAGPIATELAPGEPDAAPVRPQAAQAQGPSGLPADAAAAVQQAGAQAAGAPPDSERRQDLLQRKAIEAMAPEEKDAAIAQLRKVAYTDPVTGLGNRAAFEARPARPIAIRSDVDSLKWFNDTLGHEFGDSLLRLKAAALQAAGVGAEFDRVGGDEFYGAAASEAAGAEAMAAAQAYLDAHPVSVTLPNGENRQYKVGFSYGIAKSGEAAEAALLRHKAEREKAGLRAGRGAEPPRVGGVQEGLGVVSTGDQGDAGRQDFRQEVNLPGGRREAPVRRSPTAVETLAGARRSFEKESPPEVSTPDAVPAAGQAPAPVKKEPGQVAPELPTIQPDLTVPATDKENLSVEPAGKVQIDQAYIDALNPLQRGRLEKSLNQRYNTPDGERSLREHIESGKYVRAEKNEVSSVKYNRHKFNRMDAAQQKEYEKRLNEKKTVYSVVTENNAYFDIPKIVFDAIKGKHPEVKKAEPKSGFPYDPDAQPAGNMRTDMDAVYAYLKARGVEVGHPDDLKFSRWPLAGSGYTRRKFIEVSRSEFIQALKDHREPMSRYFGGSGYYAGKNARANAEGIQKVLSLADKFERIAADIGGFHTDETRAAAETARKEAEAVINRQEQEQREKVAREKRFDELKKSPDPRIRFGEEANQTGVDERGNTIEYGPNFGLFTPEMTAAVPSVSYMYPKGASAYFTELGSLAGGSFLIKNEFAPKTLIKRLEAVKSREDGPTAAHENELFASLKKAQPLEYQFSIVKEDDGVQSRTAIFTNPSGPIALNESYLAYFKKNIKDLKLKGTDYNKPVGLYSGDKLAGLLMPLRMAQYLEGLDFELLKNKPAPQFGAGNKLVTPERAEELKKKLRAKLDQVSAGVDPELIALGTELAVFYIEGGVRRFADFAQRMMTDLGAKVKPYLRSFYEAARHFPGNEAAAAEMSTAAEITTALAAMEKEGQDVSDTARDLAADRGDGAAQDRLGREDVSAERQQGGPVSGRTGRQDEAGRVREQGDRGVSDDLPGMVRAGGPDELYSGDGAAGAAPGVSGSGEQGRGGRVDDGRVRSDAGTGPGAGRAADQGRAAVLARELAERIERQKRASAEVAVAFNDEKNIRASLPLLLPEQQDDVIKAERRFFGAQPGKGMLFTNGTGTGKTYTGLGVVNRHFRAGKKNILIVVPTQQKVNDWIGDAQRFDLTLGALADTRSAGTGPVITTYANFRANEALEARAWDLVVYDESHKLISNEAGEATAADQRHRSVANAPSAALAKAKEKYAAEIAAERRRPGSGGGMSAALREKIAAEQKRLVEQTKALFLSATPFAYHKALLYADGFLFDIRENRPAESLGYNEAGAEERFFVSNFGYRMRYNKLTQPEAGVDVGLMEREFVERLRREGAVAGRKLEIPFDYSREFVLLDSQIGKAISDGMSVVRGFADGQKNNYRELPQVLGKRYSYLYQSQLLEAIKARQSVERIEQHLALGRKVIVFHNYISALPAHPFNFDVLLSSENKALADEVRHFYENYPQYRKLDLGALGNPVDTLLEAFGARAAVFNGQVSASARAAAIEAFNRPGSGVDLIVVQMEAGKEGISLHDTTGTAQRVVYDLGLPAKPTDAIQTEGRAYRVGNLSDAIFEYPVLHTSHEKWVFGGRINQRVRTAENLAMGAMARDLETAFKEGYANPVETAPDPGQGKGGKAADSALEQAISDFARARTYYFARQKKTARSKAAEGVDYFATPEPLGLKMVEFADIRANDEVLEPSAGHGAIGRFFPETSNNTFIEPAGELAAELSVFARGDVKQVRFEDLHAVNKFDAIVMNPPFGQAGKTAMEHVEKAARHLRNGGRIVAIVPDSPSMQKRLDKFHESELGRNMFTVADMVLPAVVFARAGTQVRTRLLVLDKQLDAREAPQQRGLAEIAADSIGEFFDKIESLSMPARKVQPRPAQKTARDAPGPEQFEDRQFAHTKTGEMVYIARPKKYLGDGFARYNRAAREAGGYYSKYKSGAAVPGFAFDSEEKRAHFYELAAQSEEGAQYALAEGRGRAREVTLADVQAVFAGQAVGVSATDPDVFWVRFKNGAGLEVQKVEQIAADRAALALAYGSMDGDGRLAAGKYQAGRIELNRHLADRWVLAHESYHFLEDAGLVTRADVATLRQYIRQLHANGKWRTQNARDVGGAEDRAVFVAARLQKRAEAKGLVARVLQKVGDIIDALGNLVRRTAAGVVRDVESGALFGAATESSGFSPAADYAHTAARWYSQMTRHIEARLPGSGAPGDMASMVAAWAKKGEIKAEELEWHGLADWLDQQQGKVTRQQVLDYLTANQVQAQEVVKGGRDQVAIKADIVSIVGEHPAGGLLRRDYALEKADPKDHDTLNRLYDELDALYGDAGPRYSQYQLPGGENYRELLLTLPTPPDLPDFATMTSMQEAREHLPDGYTMNVNDFGLYEVRDSEGTAVAVAGGPGLALDRLNTHPFRKIGTKSTFMSSHWFEPNVLAHVRFNERTGPNGERILFIEELQSDWHQKGRKKGYHNPNLKQRNFDTWLKENGHDITDVERDRQFKIWQNSFRAGESSELPELVRAWHEEQNAALDNANAVPDAPFKKTWPILAIKRMVRYAAENGFDSIAWTPGAVQAARYDLSKQVGDFLYWFNDTPGDVVPGPDEVGLSIYDKSDNPIMEQDIIKKSKLEDYIGKDAARRVLEGERVQADGHPKGVYKLEVEDLKVGGKGMSGFYDKILPAEVNKFFNKAAWGNARVGQQAIDTGEFKVNRDRHDPPYRLERADSPDIISRHESAEEAWAEAERLGAQQVWALPITDEMRHKALSEGMPLFKLVERPEPGPALARELEKNRTFVNQLHEMADQARENINVATAKLQVRVQELAGAASRRRVYLGIGYNPEVKDSAAARRLDRAMFLWRDLGGDVAKIAEFKAWAEQGLADGTIAGARRVYILSVLEDLKTAENLSAEQKAFVDEMGERFDAAFELAERSQVVQSFVDNYVRRIYRPKKEAGAQAVYSGWAGATHGFKVAHGAALQRRYDSALAAIRDGYELAVSGITNSYDSYMQELAQVMANRAFIARGLATYDLAGRRLFTTNTNKVPGYEDYRELKAPGFAAWQLSGTVTALDEAGLGGVLETNSWGKKVFLTQPEQVPERFAVYASAESTRAVKIFYDLEQAQQFAQEKGYARIERRAPLETANQFQKMKLFAPAPLAEMINKMTATEQFFSQTPGLKELQRLNAGIKGWILMSSFFHHLAGTRSWVFGIHHNWGQGKYAVLDAAGARVLGLYAKKAQAQAAAAESGGQLVAPAKLAPWRAYKMGLDKVNDLHPLISLGVKHGLTLGELQDWAESALRAEGGLTERLARQLGWDKTVGLIERGKMLRERWANSLFKKFFAGLKAEAFVVEYVHELAKAQQLYEAGGAPAVDADSLAEKVARLINEDFGGLHLKRMGRNPTLQALARLMLLAPDWTESNWRTVVGMVPGLNQKLSRMVGDVPPPKGMEQVYRNFQARIWLRLAGATLIAQLLLNGFDDSEKFYTEQITPERWRKFRWTQVDISSLYAWLGIDLEGNRKTFSVGGHFLDPLKALDPFKLAKGKASPAMRALGAGFSGTDWADRPFTGAAEFLRTGQTIKQSPYEPVEGGLNRLPAALVNQVINMQPIQVGQFLRYLQGEEDGLSALLHSAGMHVHTAWRAPAKEPVALAVLERAAADELRRLQRTGALAMGPPGRAVVVAGVPQRLGQAEYAAFVQRASELAAPRLAALVNSPGYQGWSDEQRAQKVRAIIENARHKARRPLRREIKKERRAA